MSFMEDNYEILWYFNFYILLVDFFFEKKQNDIHSFK